MIFKTKTVYQQCEVNKCCGFKGLRPLLWGIYPLGFSIRDLCK